MQSIMQSIQQAYLGTKNEQLLCSKAGRNCPPAGVGTRRQLGSCALQTISHVDCRKRYAGEKAILVARTNARQVADATARSRVPLQHL